MAKLKLIESFMTVLQSAGVFAVSDVIFLFILRRERLQFKRGMCKIRTDNITNTRYE